jgi:hypothetical protein
MPREKIRLRLDPQARLRLSLFRQRHYEYSGGPQMATHFSFRIDVWDERGDSSSSMLPVDDFETAVATYWAACRRWSKAKITLRQGVRVLEKSLKRTNRATG